MSGFNQDLDWGHHEPGVCHMRPNSKSGTHGVTRLIDAPFRGIHIFQAAIMGDKMATIAMIPIGPVTTLNRSILKAEQGMSGSGGDDFICGYCGYVMLEDFDPSTVSGNPVYQCRVCENNNDLPFAASDGRY